MQIDLYIAPLLMEQDYVSIPGVGSFVKEYVASRITLDGKYITPPEYQVTFHTERCFDDNALVNYVARQHSLNEYEALQKVQAWCANLQEILQKGEIVTIFGLGTLQQKNEEHIVFEEIQGINALGKGMRQEELLPPIRITTSRKKQSRNKRRPIVGVLWVLLGIVLLGGGIWATNEWIVDVPYYEESYTWIHNTWSSIPIPWIKSSKDTMSLSTTIAETPIIEPQSSEVPLDSISSSIDSLVFKDTLTHAEKLDQQATQKAALTYSHTASVPKIMYHLIVGSFQEYQNAVLVCNTWKEKGYPAEILKNNQTYRISIGGYSDFNRAKIEMHRVTEHKAMDGDFWILKVSN